MRKPAFQKNKIFPAFLRPSIQYLPFLLCFLLFFSCVSYKLEKNLDPESKEFLSKVTYIITKEERKIFFNLPPTERENFIEEFWKKRDPKPDTEVNEFKEQYFRRIEEANRLFADGGPGGWLQDRGRIYILLGPPENREVYPRGSHFYGQPIEIWYYGFFPIVFIDNYWNGNYRLVPLSGQHIAEITKAQMDRKPRVEADVKADEKVVFDFDLYINKVGEDKMLIQIEVPYKNIWFVEEENKLKTTLGLSIEILDSFQKKVWEHQKNYPISLSEKNLAEMIGKGYLIEIPVNLEPGNYSLTAELEDKTDKIRARKDVNFSI